MQYVARSPAARNALEETGQMPVMFARSTEAPPPLSPPGPDFDRIQRSPEFVTLRPNFVLHQLLTATGQIAKR